MYVVMHVPMYACMDSGMHAHRSMRRGVGVQLCSCVDVYGCRCVDVYAYFRKDILGTKPSIAPCEDADEKADAKGWSNEDVAQRCDVIGGVCGWPCNSEMSDSNIESCSAGVIDQACHGPMSANQIFVFLGRCLIDLPHWEPLQGNSLRQHPRARAPILLASWPP